ncbi:MAG: preprotein translocase subunit SecA [Anaerolineae bacterium]
MLRNLVSKIIGDPNAKEIERLKPIVAQINVLEPAYQRMTNEELRAQTAVLRGRLQRGETLDDILPDAFALVREAAKRTVGMRHFDVQLMGGIVLHEGKIAEMKTGEGKTLVATLPIYLNALTGKGVHLVTVNDYLARRDAVWMGPIYHLLGLRVGLLQQSNKSYLYEPGYTKSEYKHLRPVPRRQAYAADVTYGTNHEFGFDYLRDNLAYSLEEQVQRPLYYAIVDEVDNVFIDEARTPLIISGPSEESDEEYRLFARIAPRLQAGTDYVVDEKARTVYLTEAGLARVEEMAGIDNIYDPVNQRYVHYMEQALKAEVLFREGRDYIIQRGSIVLVDEFTGRLMPDRRLSDGLHQALEAKHNLKIHPRLVTQATITIQNYFRMYPKLAGMTGTAASEAEEFHKIYKLEVVVIPTHKPVIRIDAPDVVYRTRQAKLRAIIREIEEAHHRGQPVLVGTTSVEKSEELSKMLQARGIEHVVLNAKEHAKEAQIIARAGEPGRVTVATNMAGRGVDIKLGGELTDEVIQQTHKVLRQRGIDPFQATPEQFDSAVAEVDPEYALRREKVLAAGGLYVLGTERHEARRIDNQLRGRAGRQGEPGLSRFFLSLEDDLMRRFGGDSISNLMARLGVEDDMPIEHNLVSKPIESAQMRVEGYNFDIRKHLLEYDDVLNQQRELIYSQRQRILTKDNLWPDLWGMMDTELQERFEEVRKEPARLAKWIQFYDILMPLQFAPVEIQRGGTRKKAGKTVATATAVETMRYPYNLGQNRTLFPPFSISFLARFLNGLEPARRQDGFLSLVRESLELYSEDIEEQFVHAAFQEAIAGYDEQWDQQKEFLSQRVQTYLSMLEERGRPFNPREMVDQVLRGLPIRMEFPRDMRWEQLSPDDVQEMLESVLQQAFHTGVCLQRISAVKSALPERYGLDQVSVAELDEATREWFTNLLIANAYTEASAAQLERLAEGRGKGQGPYSVLQWLNDAVPLSRVALADLEQFLAELVKGQLSKWSERVGQDLVARLQLLPAPQGDDVVALGQWLLDVLAVVDPQAYRLLWRVPPAYLAAAVVRSHFSLEEAYEEFRQQLQHGIAERQAVWGEVELDRYAHLRLQDLGLKYLDALARFWTLRELQAIDLTPLQLPAEWYDIFAKSLTVYGWREQQLGVWPVFEDVADRAAQHLAARLDPRSGELDQPLFDAVETALLELGAFNDPHAEAEFARRRLAEMSRADFEELAEYVGEQYLNPLRSRTVGSLDAQLQQHVKQILHQRGYFRDERRLQEFLVHQCLNDLGEEAHLVARHLVRRQMEESRGRPVEELDYSLRERTITAVRSAGIVLDEDAFAPWREKALEDWDTELQEALQRSLGAVLWPKGMPAGSLSGDLQEVLWQGMIQAGLFTDRARFNAFQLSGVRQLPPDMEPALRAFLSARLRGQLAGRTGRQLPPALYKRLRELLEKEGYFLDQEKQGQLESRSLASMDGKVVTAVERAVGRRILAGADQRKIMNLDKELRESILRYLDQENIYRKPDKRRAFLQRTLSEVDAGLYNSIAQYLGRQALAEVRSLPLASLPAELAETVRAEALAAGELLDRARLRQFDESPLDTLPEAIRQAILRFLDSQLDLFLAAPEEAGELYEGMRKDIQDFLDRQGYFLKENARQEFQALQPERLEVAVRQALYQALGRAVWAQVKGYPSAKTPPAWRERVEQAVYHSELFIDREREQALLRRRFDQWEPADRQKVEEKLADQLLAEIGSQRVANLGEEMRQSVRQCLDELAVFHDKGREQSLLEETLGSLRVEEWRAVAQSWGMKLLEAWQERVVEEMPADLQEWVMRYLHSRGAFLDQGRREAFRREGLSSLTEEYRKWALDFAREWDRQRLSMSVLSDLPLPLRWLVEEAAIETAPPAEVKRLRNFEQQKLSDMDSELVNMFLRYLGLPHVRVLLDVPLGALDAEARPLMRDFLGDRVMLEIQRRVMLAFVSRLWIDYLTEMEDLRQGIGLEAFGQRDPLVEYKRRAYQMFQQLVESIRHAVIERVFALEPLPLQLERPVGGAD